MMKSLLILAILSSSFLAYGQTVQENINTEYSPWSLSAFSLISSELDQVNEGGRLNSYNYIGPNYRLNFNERLAVKAAFVAGTNGYDRFNGGCVQNQDAQLADPFIEYNNYNLGWLPGIADIFWSGRIYLPLSKSSRNQKMIARYDTNTIISRFFTQKVFMEFRNDVSFFHQSQTTYVGEHSNDQCEVVTNSNRSNTKAWRMENWLSLWYQHNPRLSFGVSTILRDQGYNETDAYDTGRQRNGRLREISASIGPSLRYNYSYNVSFIVSLRDMIEFSGFYPDRQDDLSEFGRFKSKNAEISLLSFIRF